MNQFVFSGRVVLSGAKFFVEAETEADAREKIGRGDWIDVETEGAEFVNWTVTRLESSEPADQP